MAVVGKAGGGHGGKEKLWRVTEDDLEHCRGVIENDDRPGRGSNIDTVRRSRRGWNGEKVAALRVGVDDTEGGGEGHPGCSGP